MKHRNTPSSVSVAVISDLHCCAPHDRPYKTHLIAGTRRTPINQHLVQALLSLIQIEKLRADVVICPGDLAHQACGIGMIQAWDHLGEIRRALRSELLLPTIGNHDVDSRGLKGPDRFEIPQTLHPEFPRPTQADKDAFWQRGYYPAALSSKAAFVVLNTVIQHHDAASAERGTFDAALVENLRSELGAYFKGKASKTRIRVAVMHHHPIIHSSAHFGSGDVLEFGDQLLQVLADFGVHFVIHGHRHEPRVTRHRTRASEQLVFAAGAFSAELGVLASRTRNLFHMIELQVGKAPQTTTGRLRTWEFAVGTGWQAATEASARIPYDAALASPCPSIDINAIIQRCRQYPGGIMRHSDIRSQFPELLRILPDELTHYVGVLKSRGYKLARDERGDIIELGKTI